MKTHAALPHRQNFKRMTQVMQWFVKQTVADTPTQHHAHHTQKQDVFHVLPVPSLIALQAGKGGVAQAPQTQKQKQAESSQIGQSVPMHGQGP